MECPVCGNNDITPFATQCSKCGTDVVSFHLLDDLEEQCVDTLKENVSLEGELAALEQVRRIEQRNFRKRINRMFWFLLLLPIMFFWCGKKSIVVPADNTVEKERINELEEENTSLMEEVEELKLKLANATAKPIPKEVTHIVKKGDSLSKLAEDYLNNSDGWKEIHRLNPSIRNARLLIPGDTIVIKLR